MVQGSKFLVDLAGIKLPAGLEKEIQAEIQAVVLRNLAKSNIKTTITRFPREWYGIWIGDPRIAKGLNEKVLDARIRTELGKFG